MFSSMRQARRPSVFHPSNNASPLLVQSAKDQKSKTMKPVTCAEIPQTAQSQLLATMKKVKQGKLKGHKALALLIRAQREVKHY